MNVKLNVLERLSVLQILPQESDFATLKIVRGLQEQVGLAEEEYKEYEIKLENGSYSWNEKGRVEKEFELGEVSANIIKDQLKEINKAKKVTGRIMTLYEKFMINE